MDTGPDAVIDNDLASDNGTGTDTLFNLIFYHNPGHPEHTERAVCCGVCG